jgi:hypothetical protein
MAYADLSPERKQAIRDYQKEYKRKKRAVDAADRPPKPKGIKRGRKSELTPEEWESYKTYHREWYRNQPDEKKKKISERVVLNQRGNPIRINEKSHWSRKKKYGISSEQFVSMQDSQNNCCAICEKPQERTMNVDHDHKTNAVRALLCNWCNTIVGMLENDPTLVSRAQAYIARHAAAT